MKNQPSVKIDDHVIGGGKCFIVAEVGQNHDGSLGMAHSFIDAVADTGADAIKFQTHIASAESTIDEPFRVNFSKQDTTRFDYWRRMEFTKSQWGELCEHAAKKGLTFLSSPFSLEAVDILQALDMPAWKIGSGEFKSHDLLSRIIETQKPILLSTGMSGWDEIDQAVESLQREQYPFVLLQCTSSYPTSLNQVGLNVLREFRHKYECLVGLSDHSGVTSPGCAAIAHDVDMLEVHVAFHKKMFGPDVSASLTMEQLAAVVSMRDDYTLMKKSPVNKDSIAEELRHNKVIFGKSAALVKTQNKGTVLTEEMLTFKKPGSGIPFTQLRDLVGKRLVNDVNSNRLLRWEDVIGV